MELLERFMQALERGDDSKGNPFPRAPPLGQGDGGEEGAESAEGFVDVSSPSLLLPQGLYIVNGTPRLRMWLMLLQVTEPGVYSKVRCPAGSAVCPLLVRYGRGGL